ncbi:histidine kinase [Paenibacillus albidus]|uniref:Histidine kinase n=2 Tax=Paenibacillus albidus TaxID=2041023 RepID=A0A917FTK5_9BACL|nr:histidine kinase [Paenibacillus albidus]
MRGWSNIRFQTKLFVVFILLSSVPALLIGTTAYHKSSEMLQDRTEQDLSVILTQLNTSIERQISDFDRFTMIPYYLPDIFSFLNQPYLSKDQWGSQEINAQKTMARLMSAYPSINSSINGLVVYGMNGTSNAYRLSGNSVMNPNLRFVDNPWYDEVIAKNGGFTITGVQEINQFNTDSFQAIVGARLLMDEEYQPLAVMAIYISPNFIPKIVRSLELSTVQVAVFDRDQRVIYSSEPALTDKLKSFGQGQTKGGWETEASSDTRQIGYNGVFLESDYLGWKTYLGVDREELLAGSRSIRRFTLFIIVALVFITAAASWLLARSLSKPIYRLIRSMRDVEKGKFAVTVPVGRGDEIGRLEGSYGRMVTRLDELVHSIEEKERQKRHAELYALRARIQPHFLYNTLNSIRMLAILQQSPHIAKLIQALNKLLQANMKLDSELVSLQEELQMLRDYVSLMDLRYTNVFTVDWKVPEEFLHLPIPPMLLQPLLENAIFHGAKGLDRNLHITVTAMPGQDQRALILEIIDDGAGFPPGVINLDNAPDAPDSSQIGLRNVRDRIRLRFGEEYGLEMLRIDNLTIMRVSIPLMSMQLGGDSHVESTGR